MIAGRLGLTLAAGLALAAGPAAQGEPTRLYPGLEDCQIYIKVLGAGQDGGAPQIGNSGEFGPDLTPSSIGLVDRINGERYLFDASPQITRQLGSLDRIDGEPDGLALDGIFLTHAHIGHYLGLAFLGREAAGADRMPVYAMPRMAEFLRSNGPWDQLVTLGNIDLRELRADEALRLSADLEVTPFLVPHRDEYSETVGFLLATSQKRALYVPDLDSWDEFEEMSGISLEQLIAGVDYAFVDATFWDDGELENRDMSEIPHPRVARVMERLAHLPDEERAKVQFIHYNHTNPIRDGQSEQSRKVADAGYRVARAGYRYCLVGEL